MSYLAEQLREHGRNYFDNDAADEIDRLEDENSNMQDLIQSMSLMLKECDVALSIACHNESSKIRQKINQIMSRIENQTKEL